MYLKDAIARAREGLRAVQAALVARAAETADTPMPGYTHLQRAQPILLAHHLLAYVFMFERDRERLAGCAARADRLPLGAGVLAGTAFPIDREALARDLGFAGVTSNSLDAVSDRDYILEYLAAAAGEHYATATDLADYLVRKGLPFRQAHEVVGKAVRHALERGVGLEALPLEALRGFSPLIEADVREALTVEASLRARAVTGGTAPAAVQKALAEARALVGP